MNASTLLRDQLLTTKFFMPSPSHILIPRPRLSGQLGASQQHKLTLGLGAIAATGRRAGRLGLPG